MLSRITAGICAGLLISIGGTVYLAAENKTVGAVLFSVALLCICYKGYALFTGKVGDLPADHSRLAWSVLLLGLAGNTAATILGGYAVRYAIPAVGSAAETLCTAKLLQAAPQTLLRAIFCGMLMYLAVSIYREKQTVAGILFCVPVFILSGFEHSIADIFYFAASGIASSEAFVFLCIVLLGNSVGGMLLPVLYGLGKGEKNHV